MYIVVQDHFIFHGTDNTLKHNVACVMFNTFFYITCIVEVKNNIQYFSTILDKINKIFFFVCGKN